MLIDHTNCGLLTCWRNDAIIGHRGISRFAEVKLRSLPISNKISLYYK